jgi:hypothetical protein
MILDTSPATEPRTAWRPSARPSSTTSTVALGIPKNQGEADKLLSHAERLLRDGGMPSEYVSQLTGFLGANSTAWNGANRERLRKVLASLGETAIEPVVAAMSKLPRTDILDEGELVLRSLPREAAPSLRRFLELEQRGIMPSVRTAVMRAAARVDPIGSLPALHTALNDSDSELRDAAAALLGELGDGSSRAILTKRLGRESDDLVVASIREAIESLQP